MAVSAATAETMLWVSVALTILVLAARLAALWYRDQLKDPSTPIVVASLLIIGARAGCNHYILEYKAVGAISSEDDTVSQSAASHTRTAGVLVLVARVLVTTFYWLQCMLLLLFYRSLLGHVYWIRMAIRLCWALLGSTFVAVILLTLLECRPLHLYWQLEPDPGYCVHAYGQLLVQCLSNIAIDILLLVISTPIIRTSPQGFSAKLRLTLLYILGFFCIITTAIRLRYIYADESAQNARSFWASIQAVVSAFVANVPALYGTVMLWYRQRKHLATRLQSDAPPYATSERTSSFPPQNGFEPTSEDRTGSSAQLVMLKGKGTTEHVEDVEVRPDATAQKAA